MHRCSQVMQILIDRDVNRVGDMTSLIFVLSRSRFAPVTCSAMSLSVTMPQRFPRARQLSSRIVLLHNAAVMFVSGEILTTG